MMTDSQPTLLYDGHCALCNSWVRWVLKHDRDAVFRFAALQSDFAGELLAKHGIDSNQRATIVVVENDHALTRSDAALAVIARMPGFWKYLRFARYCPRLLRDSIYSYIARNRFRWFPRYESCPLPPVAHRDRFVDASEPRH